MARWIQTTRPHVLIAWWMSMQLMVCIWKVLNTSWLNSCAMGCTWISCMVMPNLVGKLVMKCLFVIGKWSPCFGCSVPLGSWYTLNCERLWGFGKDTSVNTELWTFWVFSHSISRRWPGLLLGWCWKRDMFYWVESWREDRKQIIPSHAWFAPGKTNHWYRRPEHVCVCSIFRWYILGFSRCSQSDLIRIFTDLLSSQITPKVNCWNWASFQSIHTWKSLELFLYTSIFQFQRTGSNIPLFQWSHEPPPPRYSYPGSLPRALTLAERERVLRVLQPTATFEMLNRIPSERGSRVWGMSLGMEHQVKGKHPFCCSPFM